MFPAHHKIKKSGLLIALIFPSVFLHAQNEDPPDSTRLLSEDLDRVIDTVVVPDPEDITGEDDDETDGTTTNIYFLQKGSQANGGGPDSIQWRQFPDSSLKKLQKDENFWYVNYPFEKKEEEAEIDTGTPFMETPLFQTILWLVIIGGFATFVIIYLANSNVGLFRKKNNVVKTDEAMEAETDNIFEINYQKEIDRAVSKGNYRFAVRLMFLQLLKNLSDKQVIQYRQDSTNFDYLLQLHPTRHYQDFFRLTRNYEYSWYGQFDIDPDTFSLIRKDFENFDYKLNHR
ncbi:MAG: hypothetical protein WDO71_04805 [Bacteroidota bacterium]